MKPLFGNLFDINGDGIATPEEELFGLAYLSELEKEEQLHAAGLDLADLETMDGDERRDALEAAGLDPDEDDWF